MLNAATPDHPNYLGKKYLPELDGLRALSVATVIGTHMKGFDGEWLGGSLGVTIFFVLSGYLITRLALLEERGRGALNQWAFMVRRVCRLFPLYYLILAFYIVLVFGWSTDAPRQAAFRTALPFYLTYCQEWPVLTGINTHLTNLTFYQSWTLGIEEKFYLVWPWVGFVLWRGRPRVRRWGTVALAALMALAPRFLGDEAGQLLHPYSSILIGCLAALVLDDAALYERVRPLLDRSWAASAILVGLVVLHFGKPFLPWGSDRLYLTGYAVVAALAMVVLILRDGPVQRFLRLPPLLLCGRLSYGMYLVHLIALNLACRLTAPIAAQPGAQILTLVLAYLAAVAIAYPLKLAIEDPGIALGRRLSHGILHPNQDRGNRPATTTNPLGA